MLISITLFTSDNLTVSLATTLAVSFLLAVATMVWHVSSQPSVDDPSVPLGQQNVRARLYAFVSKVVS